MLKGRVRAAVSASDASAAWYDGAGSAGSAGATGVAAEGAAPATDEQPQRLTIVGGGVIGLELCAVDDTGVIVSAASGTKAFKIEKSADAFAAREHADLGPPLGLEFETAAAMATACRKQFGADFGLAISEFPAFDPNAKKPAEYCFAVASAEGVHTKAAPYVTHPSILKVLGAKRAMNFLRLRLLGS